MAEAIGSFAPRAGLVAGAGLGGLTALAAARRAPGMLPRLALVKTLPGSPLGRTRARTGAERFASREAAFTVLAARRPELSRPALRREICYEIVRDPDGAWVWRHHPGNLPVLPGTRPGEDHEGLWEVLSALTVPAALVRGDWTGRPTAAGLTRLRQHAPDVETITIPGAGEDIAATRPAALAAALNRLLARQARGQ